VNNQVFRKLEKMNLVVTALASAAGFAFFSLKVGVGLPAGALLMSANFIVLRRLTAFLAGGPPKKMAAALTLLLLKLALFFGAVWAAMTYLPMSPFAFGLGAGFVLLTVVLTTSLSRNASENP
jgi:hypothetical protein